VKDFDKLNYFPTLTRKIAYQFQPRSSGFLVMTPISINIDMDNVPRDIILTICNTWLSCRDLVMMSRLSRDFHSMMINMPHLTLFFPDSTHTLSTDISCALQTFKNVSVLIVLKLSFNSERIQLEEIFLLAPRIRQVTVLNQKLMWTEESNVFKFPSEFHTLECRSLGVNYMDTVEFPSYMRGLMMGDRSLDFVLPSTLIRLNILIPYDKIDLSALPRTLLDLRLHLWNNNILRPRFSDIGADQNPTRRDFHTLPPLLTDFSWHGVAIHEEDLKCLPSKLISFDYKNYGGNTMLDASLSRWLPRNLKSLTPTIFGHPNNVKCLLELPPLLHTWIYQGVQGYVPKSSRNFTMMAEVPKFHESLNHSFVTILTCEVTSRFYLNNLLLSLPKSLQVLDVHLHWCHDDCPLSSAQVNCLPRGLKDLTLHGISFASSTFECLPRELRKLSLVEICLIHVFNDELKLLPQTLEILEMPRAPNLTVEAMMYFPPMLNTLSLSIRAINDPTQQYVFPENPKRQCVFPKNLTSLHLNMAEQYAHNFDQRLPPSLKILNLGQFSITFEQLLALPRVDVLTVGKIVDRKMCSNCFDCNRCFLLQHWRDVQRFIQVHGRCSRRICYHAKCNRCLKIENI
jgi:hypothetical protein